MVGGRGTGVEERDLELSEGTSWHSVEETE
jgi:hypothetical protein